MPVLFCLALPIAVFFGVFFLAIHLLEKRLPAEAKHVPIRYYAVSLVIGAVSGVWALVVIYLLLYMIPPNMSSVQAALDAQCGRDKFVADPKGYSTDPGEYWYGENARCEYVSGKGWVCTCDTP